MFEMPGIGRREVDLLTEKALDDANWACSKKYGDPDSDWARETAQQYYAWVNYSRQTFPDSPSNFMLEYERGHGCRLPFDHGDRWEFNEQADSWVIVKPDGQKIITRKPK